MSYYSDICDKTINFEFKNKHLKSITHNESEKSFRIILSIERPNFFNVDDLYKGFINNHNKKFYFYSVECNFNLIFDNSFFPCIESDLYTNKTICYWKTFLIHAIQDFINQGYNFSHISKMNIITINIRMNVTYDYYINQSMSMCERKINMNIARNSQLINSLDRNKNHPLIRKYLHIPLNN